jgi:hypothetical protein
MGYEDFTTYTEVDIAADRIQKTANHVDHYSKRNETTYLYKDYGADHFGDFTHKIKAKAQAADTASLGHAWLLANHLGDRKALEDANRTLVTLYFYKSSTDLGVYLRERYGSTSYHDGNTGGFGLTDWVYAKIVKSGTSLTAYLYSDSSYSTLVDTLVLTLHANHTFKYLYGCDTYNSGSVEGMTVDIENFDIGEVTYVPYPHISSRDGGIGAHRQGGIGR